MLLAADAVRTAMWLLMRLCGEHGAGERLGPSVLCFASLGWYRYGSGMRMLSLALCYTINFPALDVSKTARPYDIEEGKEYPLK
jgi:hypothetical protein